MTRHYVFIGVRQKLLLQEHLPVSCCESCTRFTFTCPSAFLLFYEFIIQARHRCAYRHPLPLAETQAEVDLLGPLGKVNEWVAIALFLEDHHIPVPLVVRDRVFLMPAHQDG